MYCVELNLVDTDLVRYRVSGTAAFPSMALLYLVIRILDVEFGLYRCRSRVYSYPNVSANARARTT